MISLSDLQKNKLKLIQLAKLYHASNLRVFGSVARGENTENSEPFAKLFREVADICRVELFDANHSQLNIKIHYGTIKLPDFY